MKLRCSMLGTMALSASITSTVNAFLFVAPPVRSFQRPLLSAVGWDFDFSSKQQWEEFYQHNNSTPWAVPEWHSSIPSELLCKFIEDGESCLLIGCGLSHLPTALLQQRPNSKLILMDSSPTCISHLQERYGDRCMYVCGDAMELQRVLETTKVHVILDKGLMDALFCNEGWDYSIPKFLNQACHVLTSRYILVSYRLPASTRAFLQECSRSSLKWEFDIVIGDSSRDDRVEVSIGRRS